jgi:hypothetical protein
LPRVEALAEVAAKGAVAIGPGFDRVLPAPEPIGLERAEPAIHVEVVGKRRDVILARAHRPIEDVGRDQVVAVLEDVHPDIDHLAEQALDGVATAIKLRGKTFDDETGELFCGRVHASFRGNGITIIRAAFHRRPCPPSRFRTVTAKKSILRWGCPAAAHLAEAFVATSGRSARRDRAKRASAGSWKTLFSGPTLRF